MAGLGVRAAAQGSRLGRFVGQFGLASLGSASTRPRASTTVSAVVVAAAAMPFAGWAQPAAWLVVMLALIAGQGLWVASAAKKGVRARTRINPFAWLESAGFAAAAFYLVFRFTGAAQTLGVTLYGVVMFQILARDYATPRKLIINLLPMIASVCIVQAASAAMLIAHGYAWRMITLFASPYVVFCAFRTLQANLNRSRQVEIEARTRIAESEARYRLLAEHSPDVIMSYDIAGRIDYMSPAMRLYGAEPETLIGRNVRDFLDPAELARSDDFLKALARGDTLPQGDENVWRSQTPDGRNVLFEAATSPIMDDTGRVLGAMAVLRDITARRALEDELRRKTADAEAATQAKSEFLANMSHEIRTPLTGVIGFARLLQTVDTLPEVARQYADRIKKSADALLSVVNDVLDFSKLEAGRIEIDRQPTDPIAFIEETVDLIRDRAAEKGLAVRVDGSGVSPQSLLIDAPRLRQVLLNLLVNAVKFTEAGEIRIHAAYDADEARLSMAVQDTGIGIAPEVAGRLFQRFSQVDGSNTRQHGGSGLGLAISKALVELMGGAIGVESAPGAGSTFSISLFAPLADADPEMLVEDGQSVEIRSVRLLVVDDVQANRELVRAILESFDADVSEAPGGLEAVERTRTETFDVILMDLQMPVMDGVTAAATIRERPGPNRQTPILALSANVLPAHVEACRKAGMNDHIGKPIDPAELLGKIAYWTSASATLEDDFAELA